LSNALETAVAAIDRATADPFTARCYTDPGLAAQIKSVRDGIDNLRDTIDRGAAGVCETAALDAIKAGAA